MADITVSNNHVTFQSFKPKVVEMHARGDLETFQDAANAVGVGLQWTTWRMSVEVGSEIFEDFSKGRGG